MTPEIERHLTANSNMRKKDIILGNFLGGLTWGIGSVLGATIAVAIIIGILSQFYFIPGVDNILNQVNPPKSIKTIEK